MARSGVALTDLLTAAGRALGTGNERLALAASPALLAEFTMVLNFNSRMRLQGGEVLLTRIEQADLRHAALRACPTPNTSLTVRVVAAPALQGPGAR